ARARGPPVAGITRAHRLWRHRSAANHGPRAALDVASGRHVTMSWLDFFKHPFATPAPAAHGSQDARLEEVGLFDAGYDPDQNLTATQLGSRYVRRLTQSPRDLAPVTQERALEMVYWLWETNPLGKRIIELTKDFVVGEGVKPEAGGSDDDEASKDLRANIQQVLDDFWDDPVNAMAMRLHAIVTELGLWG